MKKIIGLLMMLLLLFSVFNLTHALAAEGDYYQEYKLWFDKATGTITRTDKDIVKIDIPSEIDGVAVTSIGDWAFEYCEALESISIPEGVISIGDNAFCGCFALSNIVLPDSLSSIGFEAFFDCDSLQTIAIPNNVNIIDNRAFASCEKLMSIYVGPNNPSYTSQEGVLFDKLMTTLISYPQAKGGSYSVPDTVTSIGEYAFLNSTVTKLNLPNSLTSIQYGAFYYSHLENITLPDSLIFLDECAFAECNKLKCIVVPSGITKLPVWAFAYCTSLESITIPKSVTVIDFCAFGGCEKLKDVYYQGSEADFGKIEIDTKYDTNYELINADIHYNHTPSITVSGIGAYAENISMVYTRSNATVNAEISIANNAVKPEKIMIFVISFTNGTMSKVTMPEKTVGADSVSVSFEAANGDKLLIWGSTLYPITNVITF